MSNTVAIGILHGREETFPAAVMQEINSRESSPGAESILLGGLFPESEPCYRVIIDRISHRIPFYRCFLRQQAGLGAACLPEALALQALDRLVVAQLAHDLGIPSLETVALPTKDHPPGVASEDMLNLIYPLAWDKMLDRLGLPACFRPLGLDGSARIRIETLRQLWDAYAMTESRLVVLQASPRAEEHVMVLMIGTEARALSYRPEDDRYERSTALSPSLQQAVITHSQTLSQRCGLSMCGIEWAITSGKPQLVDLHCSPNLDWWALGEEHFSWAVRTTAELALARCGKTSQRPPRARGNKKAAGGRSGPAGQSGR